MRKIGIFVFLLILGLSSAMAQNNPGRSGQRNMDPTERAKEELKQMDENLDLSNDQKEKVYDILLDGNNKRSAMFEEMRSGSGDREAMREKMRKLREEQNTKLKGVLSEKQWTKYEKIMEERRQQFRGSPGGRR